VKRRFELIVFDWDGTLMDSEYRIVTCMQRAAHDVGISVPTEAAARDIIGLGMTQAVKRLFPHAGPADVEALVDAYRRHWLGDEVAPAAMFSGARELIEGLHLSGFLLAVATGKSRHGLDKAMEQSGLGGFFHASRCADEAFSKPHPQMLQDILVDLDTQPAAAVVVGDTEYDMQMACSAKVAAVGVAHGVHAPQRLFAHGAMRCFDDLSQLSDWLHEPAGNTQGGG
jgi:phosphoglycolate phosphatase